MSTNRHPIASTTLGLTLGLMLSYAAQADDTEVLVGTAMDSSDPNILFVIDTSGSMRSEVVINESYDPALDYRNDGIGASCRSDRVYFTRLTTGTLTVPNCGTSNYVNTTSFYCEAANQAFVTQGLGFHKDNYAQWDANFDVRWETLRAGNSGTPAGAIRPVDCRSDAGLHGDGVDDAALWHANGGTGPWTDDPLSASVLNWDSQSQYVFYSGNYLNWVIATEAGGEAVVQTRLEVVKDVVDELIGRLAVQALQPGIGYNIGMMRFSSDARGGMVVNAIDEIVGNQAALSAALLGMEPGGNTPLAETMYEAHQYYTGGKVDYGVWSNGNGGINQPSVAASISGGNYISPITGECQKNYAVLLTDGLPTSDTGANGKIATLTGSNCVGNCLDEISVYMHENDMAGGVDEDQIVDTFTIGFFTDQDLLEDAATGTVVYEDENGDEVERSGYFVANDREELVNAFNLIFESIETDVETFSSPAVSINSLDRLTHRDTLYFPMFQPPSQNEPHWEGNLKAYRLGASGTDMDILDADNRVAVDEFGLIRPEARSFWSAEPDGSVINAGGMVGRLNEVRNVFTNATGKSNIALNSVANLMHETNANITHGMLGLANNDDDERTAVLRWSRGVADDGVTARQAIGDPLHSQPLAVNYNNGTGHDLMLYFGTNDGFLHGIDPTPAGNENLEQFAFIPTDLLGNLKFLKDNPARAPGAPKVYGMDGSLTYWIENDDGDSTVDPGERLLVIAGMRRGGRNYYALDVTNPSSPKLAWTITGDSGDFDELGQSWSAPAVGRLKVAGTERPVLFFGGGYDTNQDSSYGTDSMGRAVFIVDVKTGQRLWWASNNGGADLTLPDMDRSIPSDVRIIDTNQDGLIDRMYVGDMKARVWRFDIDNEGAGLNITGGIFADLGGENGAAERRFFYPPSVSRIADDKYGTFLTVSMGTGYRSHPLDTGVDDRLYMMRDVNIYGPQRDLDGDPIYATVTEADLLDITDNASPSVADLNASKGWKIDLTANGEKSLATPLTADNRIFFTTYLPSQQNDACNPAPVKGSGRMYTVDIVTGGPSYIGDPDNPEPEERYKDLNRAGIPPSPTLVFSAPPDGGGGPDDDDDDDDDNDGNDPDDCDNPASVVTMIVATETVDPNICTAPQRTFWQEEAAD